MAVSAKLAQAVAKVAHKTFHMENGIGGSYPLAGQGGIAEAEQRVAAGLLGRHAGGDVVFDPHLGVRSKFGLNFQPQFMTAKKICYASKHCHGSSSRYLTGQLTPTHLSVRSLDLEVEGCQASLGETDTRLILGNQCSKVMQVIECKEFPAGTIDWN